LIVRTEGSTYLLDRTSMTVLRLRRNGDELRRDGEPLPLLRWPTPRVGWSMALELMVREDGAPTVRTTTPVVQVLGSA
jgi:hypothetical protein